MKEYVKYARPQDKERRKVYGTESWAQPMRLFIRQRNNARVCRATQQELKTGNRYPLRTEKSRQMELPARWTQAGKSLKDGKGPTA